MIFRFYFQVFNSSIYLVVATIGYGLIMNGCIGLYSIVPESVPKSVGNLCW